MSTLTSSMRFLTHDQIDGAKWDACLESSNGPTLYLQRYLLDALSPNWCAIVKGDYQQVMPMTIGRRFGITYWYMAPFIAHTRVAAINGELVDQAEILAAVPDIVRYWDVDFGEDFRPKKMERNQLSRTNMFIDLSRDATVIANDYHTLAKRQIRKASSSNCEIRVSGDVERLIAFYHDNYGHLRISAMHYAKLCVVFKHARTVDQLRLYEARCAGETVGMYAVMRDDTSTYLILGGTNEKGKSIGAFYLLTATAIEDEAGTNRNFRFEGSDHEGIANFNSKFGAKVMPYVHLRVNRMRWPMRMFKPGSYI